MAAELLDTRRGDLARIRKYQDLTAFIKKKRYFHSSYTHIWSLVSHVLCYFLYADLHKVSFPPHEFFYFNVKLYNLYKNMYF